MDVGDGLILVTGATGRQGSAVAHHLLADGWQVRALVRDPGGPAARALAERGVDIVVGDFDDRGSLDEAMRDCYGVYSVQAWREAGVDAEERRGRAVADAAAEAGIRHFVYSSVGGAERGTGIPHFESKWHVEEHIRELGLPATIWRPTSFMENHLVQRDEILAGRLHVRVPVGVRVQYIAVHDIGSFVALSFRDPGPWIGTATEIAGDSFTAEEAAAVFARTIGHDVEVVREPPLDEADAAMLRFFEEDGYRADIPTLGLLVPDLETFEQWVRATGWAEARSRR